MTRHYLLALLAALVPASVGIAQAPEQRYFEWTDLSFQAEEYQARRTRLMRALNGDPVVFLAPSGSGMSHGETFRPLDAFLYFTGLEVPDAVLGLDISTGQSIAFLPDRDARFEAASRPNDFPGRPLADDPEIQARVGSLTIQSMDAFRPWLSSHLRAGTAVALATADVALGPVRPRRQPVSDPTSEDAFVDYLVEEFPGVEIRNALALVASIRMVKSPGEIVALRRAAEVTMAGIRAAASQLRAGVDERTLEGVLEAEFKRNGAQRLAFASIVKSGPNSLWPWRILASHYDRRNRAMHDGELVIFDVGAEVDYYASDVGRTFPVSGRFTPSQRSLLEMQLMVADSIIAAVRPGVTFSDLKVVAERVIPASARPHMQATLHFGHHLGLSAADPSLPYTRLAPGMVFTVEPWYYDHEEGVAVFIEDVVLVTETGAEILTAELPRTPDDLEALMRAGR